jgi:hypothetical protein
LVDPNPISPTFTRKIIYCKRCGSRVVSNVSHCPYCGKSLLPIYKRLLFWIIAVILIGAATAALVIFAPSIHKNEAQTESTPPLVVGAPEGSSFKDLALGATVDCNSLLVTVTEGSQELAATDGTPITKISVQFLNKGDSDVVLYATQWQLENVDGARVDCFIGKTIEGESLRSDLESTSLAKGASYTAVLYFATTNPTKVIFAPDVLSYSEQSLVIWLLPQPEEPETEEETEGVE